MTIIGISLKLYFDPRRTLEWIGEVAALATTHPAVTDGRVELVVLPSTPMLADAVRALAGTPVAVGAQDLFQEDRGAFTGAVSGADLHDIGCRYAEIGHIERRRLFGDDEATIRSKMLAAWRNELVPLLCVGEGVPGSPQDAADESVRQLASAVEHSADGPRRPLVVAYEPAWAIGGEQPAASDYIRAVTASLRSYLDGYVAFAGSPVIYGGSAGPGSLRELSGVADGLFLGRFAHDTGALRAMLDEILLPR